MVQLELIFFATEPRAVWSNKVSKEIPTKKWDMEGGFTYYGKALKKAFETINAKVRDFDSAMLYFFTDGHAGPDIEAMIEIEAWVRANVEAYRDGKNRKRSKLNICLMSEMDENPTMWNIDKELNRIFEEAGLEKTAGGTAVSKILNEVEVGTIGDVLIENFAILAEGPNANANPDAKQ